MPPKFLYFDLGRVVVDFDVSQMFAQIAAVAGCSEDVARKAIFDEGLQNKYEEGKIDSQGYYEAFCRSTGARPSYEAMAQAASDFFEVKSSMLPVLSHLRQAGYRMGILSNTCENHWEHCCRRFAIVAETFHVHALSYRVGASKPQPAIYQAAADLAGCRMDELFFVDDLPANVAGAKSLGIDAVLFTSATQLVADLRSRGIRFNY